MIDKFTGEYAFLSNFYLCRVDFEGLEYPSSEHAFQAAKTLGSRTVIQKAGSPAAAKSLGRLLPLRQDWDHVKLGVMSIILADKFSRHKDLWEALLATGTEKLVEGNTWNDHYWGVCKGRGENHLGKILMKIRHNIQASESLR